MLVYDAVLADPSLQEGDAFTCTVTLCRPKTATVRQIFAGLQLATNRAIAALGISTPYLTIDGDLGSKTAAALRAVWMTAKDWAPVPWGQGVTQEDMIAALSLGSPNLVAKYAVPLASYMERVVTETFHVDPEAIARTAAYDRERLTQTSPVPAPTPSSPWPQAPAPAGGRSSSRVPWIVAGVGAAAAVGLTIAAVAVSRRNRRRRR